MREEKPTVRQIMDKNETGWLYLLKRTVLFKILGVLILLISLTVVFVALTLKSSLLADSAAKTQELSNTIYSSLRSLMLSRNPDLIQSTMKHITTKNSSIMKAFIIDKAGRIVYSSDQEEIGKVVDRYHEDACHSCHAKPGALPASTSIITKTNGVAIHRNVTVIYNEKACYGCHAKSEGITGKLIIDRSLKSTYSLIAWIELIILAAGLVCVIVLIPLQSKFLSSGINKYIDEILRQIKELRLLYAMMDRISKTIDIEKLKLIIIDILRELLRSDEITVILPDKDTQYRLTSWENRGDRSVRRKADHSEPSVHSIADDWVNGRLCEKAVSDDRKQICMTIKKGDKDISLIVARKAEGVFDLITANFLEIISAHIAVAFENALLYQTAITDELTTLYTPRYLRVCLDREFSHHERYGEKMTFIMADIDNFKKVNDTYGHQAGDSVLKEVAKRIKFSIRGSDLAFRYGGEEFAVILPSTDLLTGQQVAERARQAVANNPFLVESLSLNITISLGVAICPGNASTAHDLILTADKALYEAKHAGKNKVVVARGETESSTAG